MNDRLSHARISGNKSRLINYAWCHDKYPDMPILDANVKLTVMDVDGPGVITNIHCGGVSNYWPGEEDALWIRVYYDFSETPAIDMSLAAFMGDVECLSQPFATEYFSKFPRTHNLYLPMPFKKHIRIDIENITDRDQSGGGMIQYELLDQWDDSLGHLHVQYRKADLNIPTDLFEACNVEGDGVLVAHWLHIKANNPLCETGQYVCEANDECYIDGEEEPSYECLGTEDLYGNSWGFNDTCSDGRSAIICEEGLETGDLKLTMLRCRVNDRLRFRKSCRLVYNYREEFFSKFSHNPEHWLPGARGKVELDASYQSACNFNLFPEK